MAITCCTRSSTRWRRAGRSPLRGAGSAGCILANRLSADGRYTVCILEAGPPDWNPYIHIPAGFIKTLNPAAGWALTNFLTVDMTNIAPEWYRYTLTDSLASDKQRFTRIAGEVKGVTEETTNGVARLYKLAVGQP